MSHLGLPGRPLRIRYKSLRIRSSARPELEKVIPVKLTQRFVDTVILSRDREEDWYMDDEVRGFGLRLQRGKKEVTRTI
jgi:hypothetical protein